MMNQNSYDVTFRLDIPAAFKYLNVVSNCLTAVIEQVEGLSEKETVSYNVVLAVHEICTNIVEHAYGGQGGQITMEILLNEATGYLVINVYDTGQPFDLSAVPQPDLDSAPIRGYGLFLVHELMDDVSYTPGDGRNYWRLTKLLIS